MASSLRIDGPTPEGGAYAEITFLDELGNFVDQKKATRFESVEYDRNGNQLRRTVGVLAKQDEPIGLV